jgi:Trk K+ transport system NAD-binding subunit
MMMNQEDSVTMVDIQLRNEELTGRPLRRIKLARAALIVGVHRDGEVLVPRGDTVLRLHDILVVVGNPEALREVRRQLDPGRA